MDTAAFRADLDLIPETLDALADALEAGLPGLDRLPSLGASRVLVLGMGSSRYAADVVARRFRNVGANVLVELASTELLPPAAPDLVVVAVSATGGSAAQSPPAGRRASSACAMRSACSRFTAPTRLTLARQGCTRR